MDRRQAMRWLGAAPLALAACSRPRTEPTPALSSPRMPVVFAAHGAPMLLEDEGWKGELHAWARALPRPKAVLVVSAHWERAPLALGATRPVPLVYDFYGFERRFYETTYAAPGAPELAARVRALLAARNLEVVPTERGLDHGAYVPLVAMFPAADVPVLQLSLPALEGAPGGVGPAELVTLGRALAPLRDEGVLVFGSGFLTHNMREGMKPGTPSWAREFDHWAAEALARYDVDALADFRARAPGAHLALPTWEHYAPVLVAAGAADLGAKITFPITGWWMERAFSRRSVQFG